MINELSRKLIKRAAREAIEQRRLLLDTKEELGSLEVEESLDMLRYSIQQDMAAIAGPGYGLRYFDWAFED